MQTQMLGRLRRTLLIVAGLFALVLSLGAAPIMFDIPAQPAPEALMAFAKQARVEVVFSSDDLAGVRTNAVVGEFEVDDALARLLRDTGFTPRRSSGGKFVVARASVAATSSVRGMLFSSGGGPAANLSVRLQEAGITVFTDRRGAFLFPQVVPGIYNIIATGEGYQTLQITDVSVRSGSDVVLGQQVIRQLEANGVTTMAPFVVAGEVVAEMDPFEVTGDRTRAFTSRNIDLPRTVNDAQAYYMFEARDIDRAGVVNLEQFIKRTLPMQAQAATSDQGIYFGGTPGNMNLRGLGTNQSLVLINGRRSTGGNLGNATQAQNLNNIPLAAIDRIEVLPSSAAAIYGASAVGGVVNVVLKRNFSGGEMKATYQNPDDTDAPIRKLDVSYGFSVEGGRTQVMLAAGYSDQKLLQTQDRAELIAGYAWKMRENVIAATGNPVTAPTWYGATPTIINSVTSAPLVLKPAYGGATLSSGLTYIPYGITPTTTPAALGAGLLANAGRVNPDLADTPELTYGRRGEIGTAPKLQSFMATIRREMTPWLELNGEFIYTGDSNRRISPSSTSQTVPANAPTNPFTTAVTVTAPYTASAVTSSNNVTRRIVTGFIARLPHDWIVQGDFNWSRGDNNTSFENGNVASADRNADLSSGALNPFVDTTLFPLDLARYAGTYRLTGRGTMNDVALRMTGPVLELPAGTPDLTIGLERRQDGASFTWWSTTYANFPARNILGYDPGKKSVIESAYVEAKVPLIGKEGVAPFIRDISLQAAWRLENFDVSTATSSIQLLPVPTVPQPVISNRATYRSSNPTVGLTWRPVKSLMIRASVGDGFVPPAYGQLTEPLLSTFTTNVSDPLRGRSIASVFQLSGGNPGLQPETSRTTAVGVVFEPDAGVLKGLRLGVDYNYIDKSNNIANLSAQVLVDNEAAFPGRVTRGPVPSGDPFGVGPITQVNTSPVNLLRAYYESIDVSVRYRKSTASFGNFDFSALGTFGLQAARKTVINTPFVDLAGYSNFPLSFTGNGTLLWDYRRFSVGWTTRYTPKIHVNGPPVSPTLFFRQMQGGEWIPSQTYHDLSFSYRFPFAGRSGGGRDFKSFTTDLLSGVELQLAVYNLFRHEPPLQAGSVFGYSTYGDIRLRDIRISIKKPF